MAEIRDVSTAVSTHCLDTHYVCNTHLDSIYKLSIYTISTST